MGINISGVLADRDVQDQEKAYIYKQNPERTLRMPDGFIQKNKIRAGQSIDIWLSSTKPVVIDSLPPKITVEE